MLWGLFYQDSTLTTQTEKCSLYQGKQEAVLNPDKTNNLKFSYILYRPPPIVL